MDKEHLDRAMNRQADNMALTLQRETDSALLGTCRFLMSPVGKATFIDFMKKEGIESYDNDNAGKGSKD